jgi:hypothetical protein
MGAYNCLGLDSTANITYSTYQTDVGTQGPDGTCVVQGATSGKKYILDSWRRIPIDNAWGFSSFFSLPDSFINRMSIYSPTPSPVFRTAANSPLYVFDGGKKRQVYSMSAFAQQGHVENDLFTASTDFLSTVPGGSPVLADGTILQDSSNGKLYVITNDGKYYIPSMDLFSAYGYNTGNILSLPNSTVGTYSNLGTLSGQMAYASTAIVFDSGIALHVPQSIETAYGFVGNNKPTYPAGVAASGAVRTGTRYLKFGDSGQLYYLENGTKRPVYSWDMFVSLGGSLNNITGLSPSAANLFPTGAPE